MRPVAAALIALLFARCAGPTPTPQIIYVTPPPLVVAPTAAPFPPTQAGAIWRTIVPTATRADFASVEGLKPPAGVYLLDWILPPGCRGLLTNGGPVWGWGESRPDRSGHGLDLAELTTDGPYDAFTIRTCASPLPWVLKVQPVGTWFGPNSVQVARLLIRLNGLAGTWVDVDQEAVSADALALESRVLDAAKRDPNLGAAVQHALAMDWYRGNHYILDRPNAAHLRRLAILAEVAQELLTGADFDTLYGPIDGYVDPLTLGLPATP